MPERCPVPGAAGQGFEEEEVAPQAGFVHAKAIGLAVDTVAQQGIAGRVRDGTAASAHATQMIARIRPLASAAFMYAQKAGLK